MFSVISIGKKALAQVHRPVGLMWRSYGSPFVTEETLYDVLSVRRDATTEEIREAFNEKVKFY